MSSGRRPSGCLLRLCQSLTLREPPPLCVCVGGGVNLIDYRSNEQKETVKNVFLESVSEIIQFLHMLKLKKERFLKGNPTTF